MSKGNVAELFAAAPKQAGVGRVYGAAGDSLNAITEAMLRRAG